jgi:hypothetical protein
MNSAFMKKMKKELINMNFGKVAPVGTRGAEERDPIRKYNDYELYSKNEEQNEYTHKYVN